MKNNNYSYGSLAYDYESVQEEKLNRYDVRVEKRRGLSKRNPFAFAATIISVACCAVLFIMLLTQYVTISYNQSIITDLKNEIKTVEDEIYNVDVQIAETLDLANVKRIAIGKLGMVTPADNQVMYISVPKEDYTVNY